MAEIADCNGPGYELLSKDEEMGENGEPARPPESKPKKACEYAKKVVLGVFPVQDVALDLVVTNKYLAQGHIPFACIQVLAMIFPAGLCFLYRRYVFKPITDHHKVDDGVDGIEAFVKRLDKHGNERPAAFEAVLHIFQLKPLQNLLSLIQTGQPLREEKFIKAFEGIEGFLAAVLQLFTVLCTVAHLDDLQLHAQKNTVSGLVLFSVSIASSLNSVAGAVDIMSDVVEFEGAEDDDEDAHKGRQKKRPALRSANAHLWRIVDVAGRVFLFAVICFAVRHAPLAVRLAPIYLLAFDSVVGAAFLWANCDRYIRVLLHSSGHANQEADDDRAQLLIILVECLASAPRLSIPFATWRQRLNFQAAHIAWRVLETGAVATTLWLWLGSDLWGDSKFVMIIALLTLVFPLLTVLLLALDRGVHRWCGAELFDSADEEGMTPTHWAARLGQRSLLKRQDPSALEARNGLGETPAHLAAQEGQTEVLRLLKERGCSLAEKDDMGFVPAHCAAKTGQEDTLRLLKELGCSLSEKSGCEPGSGDTPGHCAARGCHTGTLRVLHELGCSLDEKNDEGEPLAVVCTCKGDIGSLRLLHSLGYDLSVINDGNSLPHYAAVCGQNDALRLFHELGVSLEVGNQTNENVHYPIHYTVVTGELHTLRLLKELGCTMKHDDPNVLPLSVHAAKFGQVEFIAFLKEECGFTFEEKESDTCQFNSMHTAVRHGQLEFMKALVKMGCSLEERDSRGRTVAHLACIGKGRGTPGYSPLVLEYIKELGCPLESEDSTGQTPVHWAAAQGGIKPLRALRDFGCALDKPSSFPLLPVHASAGVGFVDCLKLFREAGCQLDAKNSQGMTPAHYAAMEGKCDVLRYLHEVGISLQEQQHNGMAPCHLAAKEGEVEALRVLHALGCPLDAMDHKNACMPAHYAALFGKVEVLRVIHGLGYSLTEKNKIDKTPAEMAALEMIKGGSKKDRTEAIEVIEELTGARPNS